jgi:hypothetical protein
MKAYLDAKGCLHVKAETELESYALRKWVNDDDRVHRVEPELPEDATDE